MKAYPIEPHVWNEENLARYRQSLLERAEETMTREVFYIQPKGSLWQHTMLLALSVNYQLHNVSEDVLVETLLKEQPMLLQMEFMSETEPGSGEFRHGTCDLLKHLVARKDVSVLKRIYHAMDEEQRRQADTVLHERKVD